MAELPMQGKVSIVGAGPGPADLLTVRAVRALRAAQVVLHDALVSPEVLALCSQPARMLDVGKRCGKRGYSQQQINALMVQYAKRGFTVVRLKSGDPSIFGRLGEELDALREAEVLFEIVPGITAAAAAATAAELTLTDRRAASSLVVLTAHRAGRAVPQPLLDPERTTVAVYMPGPNYGQTARELVKMGIESSMPCVVVSNACRPSQQVRSLALGDLARAHQIPAPAVLIVGRVAQAVRDAQGASPSAEPACALCAIAASPSHPQP